MLRAAYRSMLAMNERRIRRQLRRDETHTHWPVPQARLAAEMREITTTYESDWQGYTTSVSSPEAAASLESIALVVALLRLSEAQSVMDTGSGFSTYVFRREALALGKQHMALEDHEGWLEKTHAYLAQHDLPTNDLHLWSDVERDGDRVPAADLLFHDMGSMTTRLFAVPWMADHVTPTGMLILDDMHKPTYRQYAQDYLRREWDVHSALALTEDAFGRFAFVATRQATR